MKKIVVDLNVVLDVLGKRPGHEEAVRLFDLCVTRKVKGYLCASDVTALAQFLFKKLKRGAKARSVLTDVLDVFTTIPATESMVRDALDSELLDFCNALIEVSALKHSVDCIVTGTPTEFQNARIAALTPAQFLFDFQSATS